MDIKGLNKAEVLATLYNASKVQGMGIFQADGKVMTTEEAESLLKETDYFDYLKGKVMKIRIAGDELIQGFTTVIMVKVLPKEHCQNYWLLINCQAVAAFA